MSNFDGQAILEQANQLAHARLQSFGLSQEELENYAGFVASLNEVAVGELLKEPGIQLPDATEMIPLDDRTATQTASLFCEGVIFTIFRCGEYKVPGELIGNLTQQVAMHIYDQSKQIVAATHGQEHTPEFQISPEQQAEYITQGAESALLHYINEYEKQYGPISPEPEPEPEPMAPQSSPAQPPSVAEPPTNQPLEQLDFWDEEPSAVETGTTTSERPSSEQLPVSSSVSANHEKYGAVALLLTTLSVKQRARILNSFGPEEKELIAFYSYPQHVEQNLDAAKVESHLKKLKTLFKKREKVPATGSNRRISALAGLISPEKLLSCVKDERPVVKRYLMGHLPESAGDPDADPLTRIPPLSSRLEDIIYRYLSRRLAPELEQHLPESSSNQGSRQS